MRQSPGTPKPGTPKPASEDAPGAALVPRRRLGLARAALLWEGLWPAAWPAAGIAGLFLALALFGVLPLLPGWLHAAVLALFALAFLAALARGARLLRLPGEAAAVRRLERDSGLAHRPLSTLRDRLAAGEGDPATAGLWRLHQERLRAQAKRLRLSLPHPNLAARDPLALRAAVLLVLFVAAAGTRGDWGPRVAAALSPDLDGGPAEGGAVLDIWVTPPQYTGLAPLFLRPPAPGPSGTASGAAPDAPQAPVAVPTGSTVLARVNGGGGAPSLTAEGAAHPFEAVDETSWQVTREIRSGDALSVTQGGRTLGRWPIEIVPDRAPAIRFAEPPGPTERGATKIDYAALDDYGVVAATATLRLAGAPAGPGHEPMELKLPVPRARGKEARSASFHDLTPHPWAGLPVTVRLSATDGAGQTGTSEDVTLVLPERVFTHPIARLIVEERRKLSLRPDAAREEVARTLAIIGTRPDRYREDVVVHLGLRMAAARLMLDRTAEGTAAVQQLLWELALRLEEGGLSVAERSLRDAEKALAEALERGATDEELSRLMDELQRAMDEFLAALEEQMRQAMERGEPMPQIPPGMMPQTLDRQDLQRMMDQMREMAETGARDAARQMLSQLQQMLENLRAGTFGQMSPQQSQQMQAMNEMQDLLRRQQELLDQSFQQSQQGMDGQPQQGQQGQMGRQPNRQQGRPGQQGQQGQRGQQGQQGQGQQGQQGQMGAAEQEALRRQLGEIMRRLGEAGGEIPRPLGRAERAMRDAGQALQQGQPGEAVGPQTQAVDELQQGLQSMMDQMAQQMMGMPMPGQGPDSQGQPGRQQFQRANRDPLGRPRNNGFGQDNNTVEIPDQSDVQRAREILDELRRRSGEQTRPKLERDYIDRLLRQF